MPQRLSGSRCLQRLMTPMYHCFFSMKTTTFSCRRYQRMLSYSRTVCGLSSGSAKYRQHNPEHWSHNDEPMRFLRESQLPSEGGDSSVTCDGFATLKLMRIIAGEFRGRQLLG